MAIVNYDELDTQIADVSETVARLKDELREAQDRLSGLTTIRNQAMHLEGKLPEGLGGTGTLAVGPPVAKTVAPVFPAVYAPATFASTIAASSEPTEQDLAGPSNWWFKPIKRTKTPSTERVASIILNSHRAWSREQILAEYGSRFGFPESWQNPSNALSNALARATQRGLVAAQPDGTFADPTDVHQSAVQFVLDKIVEGQKQSE